MKILQQPRGLSLPSAGSSQDGGPVNDIDVVTRFKGSTPCLEYSIPASQEDFTTLI